MPKVYLKTTKSGKPERMLFDCSYEYKNLAQQAARGVARFTKSVNAWTMPIDPVLLKSIVDHFPDADIEEDLLAHMRQKKFKQMQVLEATDDEGFECHPSLWGFQKASVRFLGEVRRGILAHDMGTGKTPISSVATDVYGLAKILVVCPNSLKWSWVEHIREWVQRDDIYVVESDKVSSDSATVIHGNTRKREDEIEKTLVKQDSCVIVLNYDQVRIHSKILAQFDYDVMICDEAHRVKNRKAQRTQAVINLSQRTNYLWLLTGTPIRNGYQDLWTLLHMCDPERFSGYWNFVNTYLNTSMNPFGGVEITGVRDQQEFSAMLSTYMFRVTKKEAMPQLPDRIYTDYPIGMTTKQEKIYEELEKEMIAFMEKELAGGATIEEVVSAENTISQIMKLRQLCLTPAILGGPDESAKLDTLDDIFPEVFAQDKQAVIFTYFRRFIPYIEEVLSTHSISYNIILGGQSSSERWKVEEALRNQEIQAVIATAQSGGEGMNLQTAQTAIFTDRDWTPANNDQAESRLHRGEIKTSPNIITLYHPKSVEVDMRAACNRKERMFDETVGAVETVRELVRRKGGETE